MYLVEMIGSYKDRAWVSQSSLFSYKGIESFKTYAQDQVDRAVAKSDKERLAERFQLKVANNRRDEWEHAISNADLIIKNLESPKSLTKKQITSSFTKRKVYCKLIFIDVLSINLTYFYESKISEIDPFNESDVSNRAKKVFETQ